MQTKILVLDDEKEIADLVALYLNNEGYEVHKFYDSKDALEYMKSNRVDLAPVSYTHLFFLFVK